VVLILCCTTELSTYKKLSNYFDSNKDIDDITWITGQDGKEKKVRTNPAVAGTLGSLFTCKDKYVALIMINKNESAKNVLNTLKAKRNELNINSLAYFPFNEEIEYIKDKENVNKVS
jgi:hypothetical protein